MQRSNYPVLKNRPELVYLDASNGFPLHERIIKEFEELSSRYAGMPGKGAYYDTVAISDIVENSRKKVAALIGAHPENIYFVSSASEAARLLAKTWCEDPKAVIAYSPEDHTATLRALEHLPPSRTRLLRYNELGDLYGDTSDTTVFFLSHVHHIYGTDIATTPLKKARPDAKFIIDASQSIARMPVNVRKLHADALYFSGHKVGGIPGVGVLYVASKHHADFPIKDGGGASLPWQSIASIGTAIDILLEKSMNERNMYLARLTAYLVEHLEELPGMLFSKGTSSSLDTCDGSGIVSFQIRGYTAADVVLHCDEHGIAVRGGDHCVAPESGNQDFVRISMQAYTDTSDIDYLIEVLKKL